MPISCYIPGKLEVNVEKKKNYPAMLFIWKKKNLFFWILQTALDIRQSVFGGKNIHVATAHEDLAYSSYVHQYSSGKFDNALWVLTKHILKLRPVH